MVEGINKIFKKIDDTVGPGKSHKPACYEDKEMLMECVL